MITAVGVKSLVSRPQKTFKCVGMMLLKLTDCLGGYGTSLLPIR